MLPLSYLHFTLHLGSVYTFLKAKLTCKFYILVVASNMTSLNGSKCIISDYHSFAAIFSIILSYACFKGSDWIKN